MTIIPKFDGGGGFALPFVDYMPYTGLQAESAVSSKSGSSDEEEKEDIGAKDLMNLIKELDGLPVDVQATARDIKLLYNKALMSPDRKLTTNAAVNIYLSVLAKIKTAKFNKDEYNETFKHIKDNGLNDAAIDQFGRIYVQDQTSGETNVVSVQEYLQNQDIYDVITNSNLLNYRANNPDFQFNNSILQVVKNGIGEKGVTEIIKNVAANLSKDELKQQGISEVAAYQIQSGISILQQAVNHGINVTDLMSENSLYEIGITEKNATKQIQAAMNYLWNAMPVNAKTWLMLKGGDRKNPVAGAYNLMGELITSWNGGRSVDFSAKMIKDPNSDGSGSGNGGKAVEINPAMGFLLGMGTAKMDRYGIGNYAFDALGRHSVIVDYSGKPLSANTSFTEVTNSMLSPLLEFKNATLAGERVNIEDSNRILIDDNEIVGLDLPIDKQAAENGIIRPAFNLLTKNQELDKYIFENKIDENSQEGRDAINKKCDELGLPQRYDGKVLNQYEYRRFAAIKVTADGNVLLTNDNKYLLSGMIEEANEKEREAFIRNIIANQKQGESKYKPDDGFLWTNWGRDNIIKGTIFIPVKEDSIIQATYGSGNYFVTPKTTGVVSEAEYQQAMKTATYVPGGSFSSAQ